MNDVSVYQISTNYKGGTKKNSNGTHEKIIQSTRSLLNVNSIYMLISQKLKQKSYVNLSTFFSAIEA